VRFFTAVKDATKKESFLVAVALALQGLRTRFRWMCVVEPDLEALGAELQKRLFTVEGQGPVMEMWLSSRLKKYNVEVATRTATLLTDPGKLELLKTQLQPLFPARSEAEPTAGWVSLDGPSSPIGDALLKWICEGSKGFFCPKHTLAKETVSGVLQRCGRYFETEPSCLRARLAISPQEHSQAATSFPPAPAPNSQQLVPLGLGGTMAAPSQGATMPSVILPPHGMVPAGAPPLMRPPPPKAAIPQALQLALQPPKAPDIDNLVDLLLNEALESLPMEHRKQITKIGHAVYRMGSREVTLTTQNGRLFVYRVGEVVRHCPIHVILKEEGLLPASAEAAAAQAAQPSQGNSALALPSAVDMSSVARIALQSAQISAGVTTTTAVPMQQPSLPFGLSRPPEAKSDPQALMSKRVEAATKAMDVNKQIVRRSINFDDEKALRKIMAKGMKHDTQWQAAFREYVYSRGLGMMDHRMMDKDSLVTFIERNLVNSISQDWAKKVMHGDDGQDGEKKEKKEKKDKKDKKKKDKKRKASDSSSGSEHGGGGGGQIALYDHTRAYGAPGPGAMDMSMAMPMYGHPGMGMMGNMMPHPWGAHPGMDMGDDYRARKKAKVDKADKAEKPKKAEKASKSRR